jgi:hypothetical protein
MKLQIHEIKTQKAKGLYYLNRTNLFGIISNNHNIYAAKDILGSTECVSKAQVFPCFARPCPLTPRHGFVDSRVVENEAELRDLARESMLADTESEIALCRKLQATHNAILTDKTFTIGVGNDGATAGINTLTFELKKSHRHSISRYVPEDIVQNSAFGEIVYENMYSRNYAYLVQLRDGPEIKFTVDNVPHDIEVRQVVEVDHNKKLLDWEEDVKNFDPGTVVYHPGGSTSSHYAVHCIQKEVPIMISRRPVVGEILKKTEEAEVSTEINWAELKQGFFTALESKELQFSDASLIMLSALQVIKNPTSFVLGLGMGCAFRLSLTACAGEMRHKGKILRKRDLVYKSVWKRTQFYKSKLIKMKESFFHDYWECSFGGNAWGEIADTTIKLYNEIISQEKNALSSFNKLVNLQHNNAWAFSKFINEVFFTRASDASPQVLIGVGSIIYDMHHKRARVKNWGRLEKKHERN